MSYKIKDYGKNLLKKSKKMISSDDLHPLKTKWKFSKPIQRLIAEIKRLRKENKELQQKLSDMYEDYDVDA